MQKTFYLVKEDDLDSIKQIAKNFRNDEISDEKAKHFLDNDSTLVYACKNNDLVVGYILIYILPRLDHGNDMMHIYHLFVLDDFQRQGIGKELMKMALKYAYDNNLHYVYLITQTDNERARHLYAKLGGYNHPDNKELYYWYISSK